MRRSFLSRYTCTACWPACLRRLLAPDSPAEGVEVGLGVDVRAGENRCSGEGTSGECDLDVEASSFNVVVEVEASSPEPASGSWS